MRWSIVTQNTKGSFSLTSG